MRLLSWLLVSALNVASPAPGEPVVAAGANGAYAAAVPAFSLSPVIAGDSVAFGVEDHARDRLFAIRAASADGRWRTLHTAPKQRPGYVGSLAASGARVAATRFSNRTESCVVGGECTPPEGVIVAGPVSHRLERVVHATERLRPTATCRRRIAQMEGAEISLSGDRIAYARRYLAFHPNRRGEDRTVVVRDLRSSKIVYRARGDWSSLGADGTLATALFNDPVSFAGTLSWYSPASPRRHRLPNRVEVFSSSPLVYAGGRIAYIRSYDVLGAELAVTDLDGNETIHARFQAPEQLEAFAFDGSRLAFAHTRFRRDRGSSDDGLPSICVGDDVLVQPNATVVEVHQLTDATRMPAAQLPSVAAYRSAAAERPECPTRD